VFQKAMQKINNRKQNAPAAGGPSEMDPRRAHDWNVRKTAVKPCNSLLYFLIVLAYSHTVKAKILARIFPKQCFLKPKVDYMF